MPKIKKGQAVSCRRAQDDTPSREPTDPQGNLHAKYKVMAMGGYRQFPRSICRMKEITWAAKAVLCDLMDRIQEYGNGRCFPAISTIARSCGLSGRTVQRALRELLSRSHKKNGREVPSRLPEPFIARADNGHGFDYVLSIPDWVIEKYRGDRVSPQKEERGDNVSTQKGDKVSSELEGTGIRSSLNKVALPSVGQAARPDPSSLLDSASKASDLSDKAKAKHQSRERKWDKDMEVEKANWKASINSWKGEKFYAYMLHLCQRYGVKVNDPVELTQGIPARFARAMNDTLKMLSVRQVSNEHWGRILERLIKEWNQGGSDIMGKKGGISVYGFRYKIDEVLDTFRDRQPVKTKPGAKTTPTVSVKEFFGVVQKKED